MLEMISAFRHPPQKSALLPMQIPKGILWRKEPAVTGYRRLTYKNHKLGRTIDVPVSATPAVLKEIGVVVASDDGFVRLFGPWLEKIYWERRLPASIYASLVVDHDRSRIIVAATSGDIAAFDLRGTTAWTQNLGRPVFATPALNAVNDTLVIAAFGHKAIGLSLEDGSLKNERDLPAPWHAERGGKAAHRNPYASPAVTVQGHSILCAGQSVVCLDATGQTLWQTDLPAEPPSSRPT